jgi:cyclic-di-AMP phosphodiesterase PgpH
VVASQLEEEIALRPFPGDTAQTVAVPVARAVMRPTLVTDAEATRAAREREAESVGEVASVWNVGDAIVREGQIVEPLQYEAIERLGLVGSSPLRALGRSAIASLLLIAVAAIYLQRMQPRVWVSGKKLLLLGVLTAAFAATVVGTSLVTDLTAPGIAYVVPAGAYAMLVALLIHPVVGIATMLPAAVLTLLASPSRGSLALFAAATVLVSVPLTTRIAARSDLRSATLRAAVAYPLLAVATVAVFGPNDDLLVALGAGAIGGLATALIVQGAMPFLENAFRLPTVTALLDLSDRNHPLLRELETKALGSYNHSVMVASLTERACREVGADPLLGTVAALYHDIGKVRQPHFFIENQQGIANPHDDLEPEVSAVIIQNHVKDGVEMATEYRLPPEVVACIGSHHGTMLVGYFYDKAVKAAIADGGDADDVDEEHLPLPRAQAALEGGGHPPARRLLRGDHPGDGHVPRHPAPRGDRGDGRQAARGAGRRRPVRRLRPDLPRAAGRPHHDRRVAGGDLPPAHRLPGQAPDPRRRVGALTGRSGGVTRRARSPRRAAAGSSSGRR